MFPPNSIRFGLAHRLAKPVLCLVIFHSPAHTPGVHLGSQFVAHVWELGDLPYHIADLLVRGLETGQWRGILKPFSFISSLETFLIEKKVCEVLSIIFISNRCPHSYHAGTPVEYEHDTKENKKQCFIDSENGKDKKIWKIVTFNLYSHHINYA